MHLTSPPSRRVVWEDGMHLAPQHFQRQSRYHEDQAAQTLALLAPYAFGLSALVLDEAALVNGALRVVQAHGLFPDGTPFHVPEADASPAPIALNDRFSPMRDAEVVSLVLPAWRPDAPNVTDEHEAESAASTARRYRRRDTILVDESSGGDPVAVSLATGCLRLALGAEDIAEGETVLPIARIRRDGHGHFALDRNFVPPVLHVAASDRLTALVDDLLALLDAKGRSLAASLAQATSLATGGAAAYQGNELATQWLLHAVRSAEGPLRHLHAHRRVHPERLYVELARLAGALCTFSFTQHPREVPVYRHLEATDTFDLLERQVRAHLDVVVSSRALVVPLQRSSDLLHTATLTDERALDPGARWFLAVRADLPMASLIDAVPRLTKTCAAKFVLELVRRAFNGFATEHLPVPPAALAAKRDLVYFELTIDGPCAVALRESREVGVYVPDAIPGAYLELAILLPG